MFNDCTWPIVIRWILFVPLGVCGTMLAQGIIRLSNSEIPFIAECLARVVEPWAFLLPFLWVLPRFNRIFTKIFCIIYILCQILFVIAALFTDWLLPQPWADVTFSILSLVSVVIALLYFLNQNYSDDYRKV